MRRGIPVLGADGGGIPGAKLGVAYVLPVAPAPRFERRRRQLVGEQIHQEAVVPRAVVAPLVAAHHAHRLEARLGVAPDGGRVVGRWVDHQAMVPPLFQQIAAEGANGVGAQAPALRRGVEKKVHPGVAILRVVFFRPLNHADQPPFHLDGQQFDAVVGQIGLDFCGQIVAPRPARVHLGRGPHGRERRHVFRRNLAQAHPLSEQGRHGRVA